MRIAKNKALNRIRDENRRRKGGVGPLTDDIVDPQPDPARTVEVQNMIEHLFDGLGDDELRQIARWKFEDDLSNREIAQHLCCARRRCGGRSS